MTHTATPSIPKDVYLDANFLVAYFVKGHQDSNGSRKLFFELVSSGIKLYLSNLGLDETLFKIYEIYRGQTSKSIPFNHYTKNFEEVLQNITNSSLGFYLIQFNNPKGGAEKAVENIRNFNLRPRDAFHLAHLQDLGISYIVTKDKQDFENISGISVISY